MIIRYILLKLYILTLEKAKIKCSIMTVLIDYFLSMHQINRSNADDSFIYISLDQVKDTDLC